jgi:hypothetical protein
MIDSVSGGDAFRTLATNVRFLDTVATQDGLTVGTLVVAVGTIVGKATLGIDDGRDDSPGVAEGAAEGVAVLVDVVVGIVEGKTELVDGVTGLVEVVVTGLVDGVTGLEVGGSKGVVGPDKGDGAELIVGRGVDGI